MAALWLGVTLLGCSQSSDVISNNLNACLIVTEAEVEFAIGTPVTPGLRQNDRQCLYQAKRNPQETVTVELNPGPDGETKSLFHDQRSKAGHQPVPGVGDGAFTLRSPIGGIQLTFLKAGCVRFLLPPDAFITKRGMMAFDSPAFQRLERLPRDRYEVASEIQNPDAVLVRSAARFGKMRVYRWCLVLYALSIQAYFFADADSLWIVWLIAVAIGVFNGGFILMSFSVLTDTVNYEGTYRRGRVAEIPRRVTVEGKERAVYVGPPVTVESHRPRSDRSGRASPSIPPRSPHRFFADR